MLMDIIIITLDTVSLQTSANSQLMRIHCLPLLYSINISQ